jgi:hypothetical protein
MSHANGEEVVGDNLSRKQVILELKRRADEAVKSRNDAARTTRFALYGCAAVLLTTLLGVGVVLTRYPLERYLYTDNAKEMCEAQVYDAPLITTNTVTEFAKDCVLDLDTFANDSFEKDLTRMASRCLTPGFRKKFMEVDWLSDRVSTVRTQLLRVSSQTTGPVLVASSGPTADGYMWRVQIPVRRTFRQGDTPKGSNERVYEVDVYRVVKDAYNPVGLGINAMYERTATLK